MNVSATSKLDLLRRLHANRFTANRPAARRVPRRTTARNPK